MKKFHVDLDEVTNNILIPALKELDGFLDGNTRFHLTMSTELMEEPKYEGALGAGILMRDRSTEKTYSAMVLVRDAYDTASKDSLVNAMRRRIEMLIDPSSEAH